MSGVIKGIKKVFKKIGVGKVFKLIKKIAKPLMIAAAIYFTAGLALAAFPATAPFAALMPGFGGITSTAAAAAQAGVAASTATTAGAAAAQAIAAPTIANAAAAGAAQGIAASTAATAANSVAAQGFFTKMAVKIGMSGLAQGGASASQLASAGTKAAMSMGDKLLLASTGVSALSALTAPSESDLRKFKGSFYGMDSKGVGAPAALPQVPSGQGSFGTSRATQDNATQEHGQLEDPMMAKATPRAKPMQSKLIPMDGQQSADNPYMLNNNHTTAPSQGAPRLIA